MLVSVTVMIAVLFWKAKCKKPGRDGHRMDQTKLAGKVGVAKWDRNVYFSTE